jgi:hypothetical protein
VRRITILCFLFLSMTVAAASAATVAGTATHRDRTAHASKIHTRSKERRSRREKVRLRQTQAARRKLSGHRKRLRRGSDARPLPKVLSSAVLFGNQMIGRRVDPNRAGWAQAFRFTNRGSGATTSITIYLGPYSRATKLFAGLYSNSDGHPGVRITSGSLSSPRAGKWNRVAVRTVTLLSGRVYWVAAVTQGKTAFFRARYTGRCYSERSVREGMSALPAAWNGRRASAACAFGSYVKTTAPAPHVTGTTVQGHVLRAMKGAWRNSPTAYTYRWEECNGSGRKCSIIRGATSSHIKLTRAEVGHTIRAVVTAINPGGSTSVITAHTTAVSGLQAQATSAGGTSSGSGSGSVPCALTASAESCWAANTGVQAGTGYTEAQIEADPSGLGFTTVNGNWSINSSGAYSHYYVKGCVSINASNVTIEDSLVVANGATCQGGNDGSMAGTINDGNGSTPTNVLIEDTTADGGNPGIDSGGISLNTTGGGSAASQTCLRCNSFGDTHSYTLQADDTLQDSYGHNLDTATGCGPHEEVVNSDSSNHVTINHNFLNAASGTGCTTGALMNGGTYTGPNADIFTNNYLQGGTGRTSTRPVMRTTSPSSTTSSPPTAATAPPTTTAGTPPAPTCSGAATQSTEAEPTRTPEAASRGPMGGV